jgi:hypothetical protein
MRSSHRQLTVAFILVLTAGAAIAPGCGGSPTSPTSPQSPAGTGTIAGAVDANHPMPHVATITAVQISAGAAITLNISNGLHSHTVSLTAVQVGQIAAGPRCL